MEAGASSGQEVLQLRAVLRSISPLIWRRLLVRGDTSVARLHEILQVAFGWQNMHLHRFEIRGREYGVHQEGGIFFDADAHEALPRVQRQGTTCSKKSTACASSTGRPGARLPSY
jgi:hypothetical protein